MTSDTTTPNLWESCKKEVFDFVKNKILERIQAMISLPESAEKLGREMEQLQLYRRDKEKDASVEKRKNYKLELRAVLEGWLKNVDELEDKVRRFIERYLGGPDGVVGGEASGPDEADSHQAGDRGGGCCCGLCEKMESCCCGLCNMLCSWGARQCVLLRLGGEIVKLIGQVRLLRREGEEITKLVVEAEGGKEAAGDVVMVGKGANAALDKILEYLKDDEVGIIGIYGTAGVGKTHLLKKIKLEYAGILPGPPQVIWAELPENPSCQNAMDPNPIELLQDSIGKQLPSCSSGWNPGGLRDALSRGRFLLLIENVWGKLDLEAIGIPASSNCKVVFTTRSEEVCCSMEASGVKLARLTDEESLKFFRHQLRDDDLLGRFRVQAGKIVDECHGLPLALKVMARVMRSKRLRRQWENTVDELFDPRTMFADRFMNEEEVLKILKYSYDHLKAEWQPCLLFCSLFDNSVDIDIGELIHYWIGEGFLDDGKEGEDVISQLISACLLEQRSNEEEKLKMHGLIRDMAIKTEESKLLVYPDSMTRKEQDGENWEQAKRISLMGSKVSKLPIKRCSNLVTLLLKNCVWLTEIQDGFFDEMSALRVLDLSNTGITHLPQGINKLEQLRYLNLSRTKIKSLDPVKVSTSSMSQLSHLNLSFTLELETIPCDAVSGGKELRTLNLFRSKYRTWVWDASDPARGLSLIDLEGLDKLEELSVNIYDALALADLLQLDRVPKSIVCLYLEGCEGLTVESSADSPQCQGGGSSRVEKLLEALPNLRELHITNALKLQKLEFKRHWLQNLHTLELSSLSVTDISICEEGDEIYKTRTVAISNCHKLEDLSWVRHLGCIESLSVSHCRNLKAVIAGHGGHGGDELPFMHLKAIKLEELPKLERICDQCTMQMFSAPSVTVDNCPKLTGELVYYDMKEEKPQQILYQDRKKQVIGT
uniref:Disease resistance protein RPS2 n=1 Tax=Anthurium amnicola TaxID=1678845 RepID=A0A1D1XY09_9ARAE